MEVLAEESHFKANNLEKKWEKHGGRKLWRETNLSQNMCQLPSGKLTWQWKMAPLKMYSLFENGIFHCHVSLPEGT